MKEADCCSRICDLVTASLLCFIEQKQCPLTKETEKNMLLSLSMVSRKIKQRASGIGCQSEQDIVANVCSYHNCSTNLDQPFKGGYNCVENIVAIMVSFLDVDSQFVQHVAGNILSSLSGSLLKYVKKWVEFIHMLLISLEVVISSIRSATSLSSTMGSIVLTDGSLLDSYPLTSDESFQTEDPCFDFTRFITLLQERLKTVNWISVAALLRILRNILKSLKLENGDFECVFRSLVVSSLIKMPWDLFGGIHVSHSFIIQGNKGKTDSLDRRNGVNGIKGVIVGTVLQLFCSLVEQNDPGDDGGPSSGVLVVQTKIINLVPELLSFYSKCLQHTDKCLSQYLRHKSLILMYRLSFHSQWNSAHPALWLKLLRCYFEDLTLRSISECRDDFTGPENCLAGSPFSASISNGNICSRHLQRLAIYLHFKCCFALVHWKEAEQGCQCATKTISLNVGLQPCSETCCHKGLLNLSEWLERCDFLPKSTDFKNYSVSCNNFALSFLQLYLEEDDLLFGMLLLLLDVTFFASQDQRNAPVNYPMDSERDVLHYIISIFDPIRLFHSLLLLLHYDHLVLVDYLISKDVGVQCAQYLLRLQLALFAAQRENIPIHQFFTNLLFIVNIITSSKRHDQLQASKVAEIVHLLELDALEAGKGMNQIGTLKRAGDTRWSSHFLSVCSLIQMFDATFSVLQGIVNDPKSNYRQRVDADIASNYMTSFDFVLILHLVTVVDLRKKLWEGGGVEII